MSKGDNHSCTALWTLKGEKYAPKHVCSSLLSQRVTAPHALQPKCSKEKNLHWTLEAQRKRIWTEKRLFLLLCQMVTAPMHCSLDSQSWSICTETSLFPASLSKSHSPSLHCTVDAQGEEFFTETLSFISSLLKGDSPHALHFRCAKVRISTERRLFLAFVSKGDTPDGLHFRTSKVKNIHRNSFVPGFCQRVTAPNALHFRR